MGIPEIPKTAIFYMNDLTRKYRPARIAIVAPDISCTFPKVNFRSPGLNPFMNSTSITNPSNKNMLPNSKLLRSISKGVSANIANSAKPL